MDGGHSGGDTGGADTSDHTANFHDSGHTHHHHHDDDNLPHNHDSTGPHNYQTISAPARDPRIARGDAYYYEDDEVTRRRPSGGGLFEAVIAFIVLGALGYLSITFVLDLIESRRR